MPGSEENAENPKNLLYYLISETIFFHRENILFYRFLQLSPICGFVQHNVCEE